MNSNMKKFNFYMNDWSNNSVEILIDTLEFNNIKEAIKHMNENGYNRVEFAEKGSNKMKKLEYVQLNNFSFNPIAVTEYNLVFDNKVITTVFDNNCCQMEDNYCYMYTLNGYIKYTVENGALYEEVYTEGRHGFPDKKEKIKLM